MLSKNQNPPQPNSVKAQKEPNAILMLLVTQRPIFNKYMFFLSNIAINMAKIPPRIM